MVYAPIVMFVYKRLTHVKRVVDSIMRNPESAESEIYFFSDAAKDTQSKCAVEEVREYLKKITGFKEVHIIERKINYGIEKSEQEGITQVINKHGKAIILEDDIEVSDYFLHYMNAALEKYKYDERVFSVTGYSFIKEKNIKEKYPEFSFVSLTSVWGWATWRDRWEKKVDGITKRDVVELIFSNKCRKFNYKGNYVTMLIDMYLNNYITWDVIWYWSAFKEGGLTLVPTKTMVNNIGMDGTGVHYTDVHEEPRIEKFISNFTNEKLPNKIEESVDVRRAIQIEFIKERSIKDTLYFIKIVLKLILSKKKEKVYN